MITPSQKEALQQLVDKGLLRVEEAENVIALLMAGKAEESAAWLQRAVQKGGKLTFKQFIERVCPTYVFHQHSLHIIEQLQKVADGELRRLIVYVQPRSGKSMLVSQLFPAYYIYLYPERFVGLASYSADLAGEFSRAAREYYKEALESGLAGVDSLKLEGAKRWGTSSGGGVWAVGRGGSCTGKGGHVLILDDPLKDAQEASSPTILKQLEDWFQAVFWTRQAQGGCAAVIICQTRWTLREISTKLLDNERIGKTKENWTIVKLEAIKEAKNNDNWPKNATIIPDWRQPGEVLCPAIMSKEELDSVKSMLGEYFFSALYQQNPRAGDGTVFRKSDFQRYDWATMPQAFDRIITSWDCTFEDETASDYVVGSVLGQLGARVYLLDRVRGQWDFPITLRMFLEQLRKWPGIQAKVVEKKASGHALVQSMRRHIPGIIAFKPGSSSKYNRAMSIQHYVAAGNIWVPADTMYPWVEEWMDEITNFPVGSYDDQVDSFVQGVSYLAATPMHSALKSEATWGRQSMGAVPDRYKLPGTTGR